MQIIDRLKRLEARAPKVLPRVILIWASPDGRRIKAADTHPHLPDPDHYDEILRGCLPENLTAQQPLVP